MTLLLGRLHDAERLPLARMTAADGARLLDTWLTREAQRTLQPTQRAAVLDGFARTGLPLYLRLAYEEARQWPSYQDALLLFPPDAREFPSDVPGIIRYLFARLSQPQYHIRPLVEHTLAYLAAARNGLSEDEAIDVLSQDPKVMARVPPPKLGGEVPDQLPTALWARLYFDLLPYLAERTADQARLITFFHRQFRDVVEDLYLPIDPAGPAPRKMPITLDRHRALAVYFQSQPQRDHDGKRIAHTMREMAELPYQQTEGELWDALYETLTDFTFLEQKAATGKTVRQGPINSTTTTYTGVYDLQEDFDRAVAKMPGE